MMYHKNCYWKKKGDKKDMASETLNPLWNDNMISISKHLSLDQLKSNFSDEYKNKGEIEDKHAPIIQYMDETEVINHCVEVNTVSHRDNNNNTNKKKKKKKKIYIINS